MLISNDDQVLGERGVMREREGERKRKGSEKEAKGEKERDGQSERDNEYARYSARLGATLANFPVVDDCSDAKSLQLPRRLSLSRWFLSTLHLYDIHIFSTIRKHILFALIAPE